MLLSIRDDHCFLKQWSFLLCSMNFSSLYECGIMKNPREFLFLSEERSGIFCVYLMYSFI